MTYEDFRPRMDEFWDQANREAARLKDSYVALDRLQNWYQRLGSRERALANRVLSEWLLSEVEAKRFDAVAMVREFRLMSALDALRQLSSRLGESKAPGARFEREKVDGLIEDLASGSANVDS